MDAGDIPTECIFQLQLTAIVATKQKREREKERKRERDKDTEKGSAFLRAGEVEVKRER